ncbi:hypothetical protein KC343_g3855 [Hortaea werneckii]|nr:hypothetical protein KC352_g11612 [Hortaea werneckii]KAI7568184.1 hypothetical protein KC317_g4423 [Hortaea werneckii]KAI7620516.1 hypothetical protein KC346_g4059 [Hortaea werneckii]KAI7631704.1 hypothetical protein KC343_g3855 [Hortaea werneckii]KAI7677890.1 hypothetical protein KC319_g3656 [Hortaea werneckii]
MNNPASNNMTQPTQQPENTAMPEEATPTMAFDSRHIKQEPETEANQPFPVEDDGLDEEGRDMEDPMAVYAGSFRVVPPIKTEEDLKKEDEAFKEAYPDLADIDPTLTPEPPSPVRTYALPGYGNAGLPIRTLDDHVNYGSNQQPAGAVPSSFDAEFFPQQPTPTTMLATGPNLQSSEFPVPSVEGSAPKDDEGLFVPLQQQFHGAQQKKLRALERNGERSATVCFEGACLERPHHHILACGHEVMTKNIEACGSNCKQSIKVDGKVYRAPFRCRQCADAGKVNIFMPRKGTNAVRPRPSQPSHVYGNNLEADKRRIDEKAEEAMAGMTGLNVGYERMRRDSTVIRRRPKRSLSPPNVTTRRSYREREPFRKEETVEERLEREAEENAVAALQKGVASKYAEKRTTTFISGLEASRVGLKGREAQNLDMDFNDSMFGSSLNPRRKARRVAQPQPLDHEMQDAPERTRQTEVDRLRVAGTSRMGFGNATQPLPLVANMEEMIRPSRFSNAHGNGGYRSDPFFSHTEERHHKMVREENTTFPSGLQGDVLMSLDDEQEEAQPDLGNFDEVVRYCVCQSPAEESMIACERCEKAFHPACVGKGRFSKAHYEGSQRYDCLRMDMEYWKRQDEPFLCKACGKKAKPLGSLGSRKRGADADDDESLAMPLTRGVAKAKKARREEEVATDAAFEMEDQGETRIIEKIVDSARKVLEARAMPSVTRKTVASSKCEICNAHILGVFYRCKYCASESNDGNGFSVCDDCLVSNAEATHKGPLHVFEVQHASGPIIPRIHAFEAASIAREASH